MTQTKDEAFYAAQAAEAAKGIAQLRAPKLDAASAALAQVEALLPDLVAHRDALASGATRDALVNVISVITSTRSILNGEQASVNATLAGGQ